MKQNTNPKFGEGSKGMVDIFYVIGMYSLCSFPSMYSTAARKQPAGRGAPAAAPAVPRDYSARSPLSFGGDAFGMIQPE